MGQLINDRALYDKATKTVDELNTIESNINAGKGLVGKLVTDDTLYNRLDATLPSSTRSPTISRPVRDPPASFSRMRRSTTT